MAGIGAPSGSSQQIGDSNKNYMGPLIVITSLFFMWGFITNLNDVLIPHLKVACGLNDFQSSFIQFAFFGAYFLMSFPAGMIIKKLGYKNGLVTGLVICTVGAFLFYPAAVTRSFGFFLFALSVLASGVTLLQVGANPYVTVLGDPNKAESRLNLTQAFNSLGATLGPYIGGMLILSNDERGLEEIMKLPEAERLQIQLDRAAMVEMPYVGLGLLLLGLAFFIFKSDLPSISSNKEETSTDKSIFKYTHLILGAIGIFVYVGAEVGIGSFLIRYADIESIGGYSEKDAAIFVSYYMGLAMIGRFIGSFIIGRLKPTLVLAVCALLATVCVVVSINSSGMLALGTIIAVGLFNSIMFPTIFSLAIKGLGPDTARGSSLLVMSIVGGALIPLLIGYLFTKFGASEKISDQLAFVVPAICYVYILFYGFIGSRPKGIKQ